MSTATPTRSAPPMSGGSRNRLPQAVTRAAGIDPFKVLRRHVITIVLSIFLGGALGTAAHYLFLQFYPLYAGSVIFEVQPGVAEAEAIGTADTLTDEDVVRIANTQIVLLTSPEVLEAAINNPDVQTKTQWFQNNFIDEDGKPEIALAVDALIDELRADPIRGTELFEIKWYAKHKDDVPIVLNAVQEAYDTKRREIDNQVFVQNIDVFRQQLDKSNIEIDDLDQDIQDFVYTHDITSLQDPRYHQFAVQLIGLLNQLNEARAQDAVLKTNIQQTAAKIEGKLDYEPEDILQAEHDFSVARHIQAIEALKVEIRVLKDRYPADSQFVRMAEERLRAEESERRQRTEEIIQRNLNAQLKQLHSAQAQVFSMMEALSEEAETKSGQLRKIASMQTIYQQMDTRRQYLEQARLNDLTLIKEAQLMRLRQDASRVRLAQRALTPRELAFPLPGVVIPLGVLLVLGVTVGVIFLRELTDQRVKSASDLAIVPGAAILGVIPDLDEDPTKCASAELAIRRAPNSVIAESYRQACAPFTKSIDRAGHQTIVCLGGLPGAGTTTAVTNLAAACAASGRRVLLVDANFRRPRLAKIYELQEERPGLGDLLSNEASVEAVVTEVEDGLSVMTAGSPASRIIERLNTARFSSLTAELRGRFDLIFFDAPPAVVAGDALMLANKLDAAVMVVRANQEQRGLVARIIHQLADTQCELIGVLLNRPRGTAGGYFKKNFATMAAYTSGGGAS